VLCASFGLPATSAAHFILQSPPASTEQNALGDPQKAAPCGDEGNAVATGEVTSYQGGDTITVTIEETIFHPGHYRIALATDDGVFPEEPPVTAGATPCGSAPIDPAPVFPVLADGVWEHSQPFAEPQTIEITLPDDVSCTNCTLQVIQFMSNHGLNDPGGCYYHHCATIALEADPVGATEGTTAPGDDTAGSSSDGPPPVTTTDDTAGNGESSTGNGGGEDSGTTVAATGAVSDTDPGLAPMDSESGCSCSLPAGGTEPRFAMVLGLLGIVGLRIRRRGSRRR
jgi:MYXO-CTERM domain-containing protein